jgi:DNA-binding PadR family transcriptional regulator
LILLSLEDTPKHGYAIMQEVQSFSSGRVTLSTGTLYGAIKRMLRDGWIRRVDRVDEEEDGRGRKYYALTERGRRVLEAEMDRLRTLVDVAGRKLASGVQSGGD